MGLFGQLSPDTQQMLGGSSLGANMFADAPQSIAPQQQPIPQGMFGAPPTVKRPGPGIADILSTFMLNYGAAQGNPLAKSFLENQNDTRLQALKHQQSLEDARNLSQATQLREQTMYDYKRAHPEPTDLERYAQLAGIQPGSPQYNDFMQAAAWNKAMPPHLDTDSSTGEVRMVGGYMPHQQPSGPPPAAVDALRRNPALAKDFEAKYGPKSSLPYLQGGAPAGPARTFP